MAYHPYYTLTEAFQCTAAIEEANVVENPHTRSADRSSHPMAKDASGSRSYGPQGKVDRVSNQSTRPNQTGQRATDANDRGKGKATIRCFKCNEYGHISSE